MTIEVEALVDLLERKSRSRNDLISFEITTMPSGSARNTTLIRVSGLGLGSNEFSSIVKAVRYVRGLQNKPKESSGLSLKLMESLEWLEERPKRAETNMMEAQNLAIEAQLNEDRKRIKEK